MYIIFSALFGSLFTLSFAPYYNIGLAFVSLSGILYFCVNAKSSKKAFIYGYLFGFFHHLTGLYWISNSMLVEADKFAWMIPFTSSLLPAYLALYIGVCAYLTRKLKFKNFSALLFFAGAWVISEYIRGNILTGFPWNLAGYIFSSQLPVAQLASILGAYGLSFFAIIFFSSPFLCLSFIKNYYYLPTIYKYCLSLYYSVIALTLFVFVESWGNSRIEENSNLFSSTNIRVVQPNIPQLEKFEREKIPEHLQKIYSLTSLTGYSDDGDDFIPDIILWPEASVVFSIEENRNFLAEVADVIPYSAYLVLGSVRTEGFMNKRFYNSIQFIDSEGNLQRNYYDKFHLVPFGEYVPLRSWLPFIEKITQGIGDFYTGTGNKTINIGSRIEPFSPLICYEVIFPARAVNKNDKLKPKWIFNATNDAWFGEKVGPYQHLDIARMRAIEEGIPLVRAANTGISAVIDSTGNIISYIPLNYEGVIDSKLPADIKEGTIFSRYGNIIAICLAILSVFFAFIFKFFDIDFMRQKIFQTRFFNLDKYDFSNKN